MLTSSPGLQNQLYIFGGEVGFSSSGESPFWILDLESLTWNKKQQSKSSSLMPGSSCPPLTPGSITVSPSGRRGHSVVIYENAMHVYGGYQDLKGSSSDLWTFDFISESWHLLSTAQTSSSASAHSTTSSSSFSLNQHPGGRHSHSAIVYQSCMYVFGGMTELKERSDFWKWDFIRRQWFKVKSRNKGPPGLHSHSAIRHEDFILIYGGERNGNLYQDLWKFNLINESWQKISTSGGLRPNPRSKHAAVGNPLVQSIQEPSSPSASSSSSSASSALFSSSTPFSPSSESCSGERDEFDSRGYSCRCFRSNCNHDHLYNSGDGNHRSNDCNNGSSIIRSDQSMRNSDHNRHPVLHHHSAHPNMKHEKKKNSKRLPHSHSCGGGGGGGGERDLRTQNPGQSCHEHHGDPSEKCSKCGFFRQTTKKGTEAVILMSSSKQRHNRQRQRNIRCHQNPPKSMSMCFGFNQSIDNTPRHNGDIEEVNEHESPSRVLASSSSPLRHDEPRDQKKRHRKKGKWKRIKGYLLIPSLHLCRKESGSTSSAEEDPVENEENTGNQEKITFPDITFSPLRERPISPANQPDEISFGGEFEEDWPSFRRHTVHESMSYYSLCFPSPHTLRQSLGSRELIDHYAVLAKQAEERIEVQNPTCDVIRRNRNSRIIERKPEESSSIILSSEPSNNVSQNPRRSPFKIPIHRSQEREEKEEESKVGTNSVSTMTKSCSKWSSFVPPSDQFSGSGVRNNCQKVSSKSSCQKKKKSSSSSNTVHEWKLCMFIFGGREEGVSSIYRQPISIWKLYV